ncbi:hypothetical protein LTR70_009500 [Exophiala xenobiotica]|nr:hypothetical protein LTR70_009500 [Exophiala xenobiotica]
MCLMASWLSSSATGYDWGTAQTVLITEMPAWPVLASLTFGTSPPPDLTKKRRSTAIPNYSLLSGTRVIYLFRLPRGESVSNPWISIDQRTFRLSASPKANEKTLPSNPDVGSLWLMGTKGFLQNEME